MVENVCTDECRKRLRKQELALRDLASLRSGKWKEKFKANYKSLLQYVEKAAKEGLDDV